MAFQALINGSDCGPANPLQNLLKHSERNQSTSSYEQRIISNMLLFKRTPSNDAVSYERPQKELYSINQAHPPQIDQAWQKQFAGTSMRPSLSSDEMARLEQSFTLQLSINNPTKLDIDAMVPTIHREPRPTCPSELKSIDSCVPRSARLPQDAPSHYRYGWLPSSKYALSRSFALLSTTDPSPVNDQPRPTIQSANRRIDRRKLGGRIRQDGNHIDAQPNHESLQQTAQDISSSESVDHQSPLSSLSQETTRKIKSGRRVFEITRGYMERTCCQPEHWKSFDIQKRQSLPRTWGIFWTIRAYPFQSNNPFLGSNDPFEEGQRLLHSGAPLSEAALAFEAACQMDENRADAWRMLGETQAANEKEQLAIKAFNEPLDVEMGMDNPRGCP
ncbi:hypothetical protein H4Q26_000676 [Puccinia striiformis f. sp. tritici PST-130]|nr:hypothetical protein H4Q26_000676 [Puccinia striiformis f. sp. tritici PST-130]